jgi:chemotaxis protein methyltransferase CheR
VSWLTRATRLVEEKLGMELDQAGSIRLAELGQRFERDHRGGQAFLERAAREAGSADFLALVEAAANGQTYFMRDPAQLAALSAFFTSRGDSRETLHVWCAGCSTGEEAYTVAMLSLQVGVAARIVASDVNGAALSRAATGRYKPWALRHVSESDRALYFRSQAGEHVVAEALRSRVSFMRHNLAVDPPLFSSAPGGSWDAILCRNVLIYFRNEVRARVLSGLESTLDKEGVLLLSSSESLRGIETRLHAHYLGGGFVFAFTPRARTPSRPPPAPVTERPARVSLQPGESLRGRRMSVYWTSVGHARLRDHDFDQALEAYAEASRLDGVHFEPYLGSALVHLKRGALPAARKALRSALFLEPRAWAAEYLLSGIAARDGQAAEQSRALARALSLLESATAIVDHEADCAGIEPLCYTREEATSLCLSRQSTQQASRTLKQRKVP